jgi:hypothetical protein
MTEEPAVPGEQVDEAAEEGECQSCGKRGLLARISSRLHSGQVTICEECLDGYRHGNLEVARVVVGRLRPL